MSDLNNNGFQKINLNKENYTAMQTLLKYVSYFPFFIISLIFFIILGILNIRYSSSIYKVNAQILVKTNQENSIGGSNKSSGGGGLDLIENSILSNKQVNIENEILVLSSPILIKKIIKEYNFNFNYYKVGKLKQVEIYEDCPFTIEIKDLNDSLKPLNFYIKNINEQTATIRLDIDNSNVKDKIVQLNQWVNLLGNEIKITKKQTLGIVQNYINDLFYFKYIPIDEYAKLIEKNLNITAHSKQSTAIDFEYKGFNQSKNIDFLNTLIKEFDNLNFENKRSILVSTLEFINNRLSIITNELKDVEVGIKNIKTENKFVDIPSQSNAVVSEKASLEKELISIEIKIQSLQFLQKEVNNIHKTGEYKILPSNFGIPPGSSNIAIERYNLLVLKKQREISQLGINSPIIIDLNNQIESTFKNVYISLQEFAQSMLLEKEVILNKLKIVEGNLRKIPSEENIYIAIKRQQNVKEGLYLYLLQKREETAISSASTISNYTVLETANGASKPIFPNNKIIYIICFIAGLLFPIIIIILKDIFDDKINNRNDIIKNTKIPIIGEIGHVAGFKKELIVTNKSRNVIVEQFRVLRTNASLLLAQHKVIIITSTTTGEGKSFVSLNTAAVFAISNKKVALLEFDLRKPKTLKNIGVEKKNIGISNFLSGQVNTLEGLYNSVEGYPTLHVYGCGPIPLNPSELILNENVNLFFELLKQQYDYIIVDTAPLGLVSDTLNLLKFANITLYVVRQRFTLKNQIHFIEEIKNNNSISSLYIVINDLKFGGRYNNYGGYGYGYSYGYGYGNSYGHNAYFDNDKNTNILKKIFKKNK